MKLNIANPANGAQTFIEIDDEKRLRALYDKRISNEVPGEDLGDEFAGYIFRISGGNDKQGFPMKQGVLTNTRVRLLLDKDVSCFRPRRRGERKRKSVRGCIVGADLSVVNLVIIKKGDAEIPGLTDLDVPKRLGPKRASKIRQLYNVDKTVDIRPLVIARKFEKKGKTVTKRPKIQRLVTPVTLQRRRHRQRVQVLALEKSKRDAAEYSRLVAQRLKEQKEARRSEISKRRSSRKASLKAQEQKA